MVTLLSVASHAVPDPGRIERNGVHLFPIRNGDLHLEHLPSSALYADVNVGAHTASRVLLLQRTAGNAATASLLDQSNGRSDVAQRAAQ